MNTHNVSTIKSSQANEALERTPEPFAKVNAYAQETQDVLFRLHSQVGRLEDLTGRLGYMISELNTLVRR